MRLWSYEMFPYLPDSQFSRQLGELLYIMRKWRDNGKVSSLHASGIMDYPKTDLAAYYHLYNEEWQRRYGTSLTPELAAEFEAFAWYSPPCSDKERPFSGWMDTRLYWRTSMAIQYEKYLACGEGRITDDEWLLLCEGYAECNCGEKYHL